MQARLDVPLALENIAALFAWPEDELTEAQFIGEVLERTGALLLPDVANLFSSGVNFAADPLSALDELPLDRIGYAHVAGGVELDGIWHDTHTHPVTEPILAVLRELANRTTPPGVLLERDGDYPPTAELVAEPTEWTRASLAAAQARLTSALAGNDPLDDERLRTQRVALVHKRSGAVAWHEPAIATMIGDRLTALFEQYAAAVPKPDGGSGNDVASFVDYLRATGVLTGSRRRPRLTGA
ncbi:MAG TPA: DUF692 family protein [Pseudonocardiaceae bacterium]|nr:DUF692 family protein [Pseudonocardiaceae bacterium]